MMERMHKPFTGWHMLAVCVAAFGLVIAVNIAMAWKAISTFPGLEVQSGYDESQNFDRAKKAQLALGWTLHQYYDQKADQLRLEWTDAKGAPVTLRDLDVLVGRPTEAKDDLHPTMTQGADGFYSSAESLALGKWMLQITAHAQDGTLYTARSFFYVRD